MKIRLNRFLSESGVASRRKSEEFIKEGRVTVNNKQVTELATIIDDEIDIVKVDGEKVKPEKKVYFLLNKPKGYITTTSDEQGRKKVTDLIKTKEKIFPVGRLDFDTTGVLILTNDGDFANFLMHPSNKILREYKVLLDKPITEEDKNRLVKGITLDAKKSRFLKLYYPNKDFKESLIVTVSEGRNHFVKRMFSALGYNVKKLERISYANFNVKGIPLGSYRIISKEEIKKVYEDFS
ncbi:MAG: pseudouridine synthase [Stygiobacter sp.]|jgi:23S rRNA pseudouridine2605 synthase|uniref:Pseudouridine synthase n=1 Tax=Stygiobacter electus TaxID=3032292 RepID=A0AAE3NV16_9BACT|nr:pseudouridine synthase [Stygiobacter electus]MDF1611441.1 pseudouridine synthase [Stygiobacter electus]